MLIATSICSFIGCMYFANIYIKSVSYLKNVNTNKNIKALKIISLFNSILFLLVFTTNFFFTGLPIKFLIPLIPGLLLIIYSLYFIKFNTKKYGFVAKDNALFIIAILSFCFIIVILLLFFLGILGTLG